MSDYLSFTLPDDFVGSYSRRKVNWGFPVGGGNSLGEITYVTKYSRKKDNGKKERWHETCRRVIEGMYSILKDHCKYNRTHWNENRAQRSAQEAYDRMFNFKWLPPGRGLWTMGTEVVNSERNSAPLYNCSFLSTEKLSSRSKYDATYPFVRLMEMSMFGIGVGFDVAGAGKLVIHEPNSEDTWMYKVPDTREGWCESVGFLLESFFFKNRGVVLFDYSEIRPSGAPLKRFGGVSAGPGPLIRLHEALENLFKGRAGDTISSMDILDIMNLIGKAVVAGNIRRSAEIALGPHSDEVFVNAKNWELYPERMGADGWGHLSNNTVIANVGDNLDHIIESIAVNGEPGIFYIDVAREFGRIQDGKNFKDMAVMGLNPCVTGDTWVVTDDGARQVCDLVGQRFQIMVDGKPFDVLSDGFFATGRKRIYELAFASGRNLKVTGDHKILTLNRDWVEAQHLTDEDRVAVSLHEGFEWGGEGSFNEGLLLGSLVGNGTFDKSGRALLRVWDNDDNGQHIKSYLKQAASELPHRSDWTGFIVNKTNKYEQLSLAAISRLAEAYGIVQGNKAVTDKVESASSTFLKGFITALFDADGHIEGDSKAGGVSVGLTQTNLRTLKGIQRILQLFGIASNIRQGLPEGNRRLPDGNGGYTDYHYKATYRLIVSGHHVSRFAGVFELAPPKQEKLNQLVSQMSRGFYEKECFDTLVSRTDAGEEQVFDVTVADVHRFSANGLVVHNCAEINLESSELCNLVETFPHFHDNADDFKRTIKYAYLYSKAVTLLPTPWPETNEVIARNRRIGTSVSGLAQFVEERDWSDLRFWLDEAYAEVQRRDQQYSKWLGIRESIKTTTTKPSGTVSILCGATPGVHWPVTSGGYIRRQRFRTSDPVVDIFRAAGFHTEPDVMDPEFSVVVEFATTGHNMRNEREVSVWEKVSLAALVQSHWADNAVSATFTFLPEEKDQIGPIIRSFEGKMKSLSFLPLGAAKKYEQMPYEAREDEDIASIQDTIESINTKALYSETEDAAGEKYCTNDVCII